LAETVRDRLRNVYWIGGGSGAGKSAVASRVASRHGLRRYSTDDAMANHAGRIAAADSPFLQAFAAMDMDERWLNRSPGVMLETFHWFRGEGFSPVVEDLLRMSGQPGAVAEGFRLLPRLVRPLLAETSHAVWLLPTPQFRRAALASRGSLWQIAGKSTDPERALANLLERDRMFTDRLRGETRDLGLPALTIDGTVSEDEVARQVAAMFGLSQPSSRIR
jgi:2-phosphoglycerate kinase